MAYPTSVDPEQANVDDVDTVLAADVNGVQTSANLVQVYLGQDPININDNVAGDPMPAPNVLGGFSGTTGGTNAFRKNPQVGWASIVATQLRLLTGGATYRDKPTASIADYAAMSFITNEAETGLTNETLISTAINVGSLASRPAAAATNNGWLYFTNAGGTTSYPTNVLARSNGAAWRNVGFYPNGTFAAGDLLYWDDTNKYWDKLPIGTSGQVLTTSGGIPTWATQTGLMITTPSTFNPTTKIWTSYTTIQAAITAAASGTIVWVPPGTYAEDLVMKAGVVVSEMARGTVTISGAGGAAVVTSAVNCALYVTNIVTTTGATDALDLTHTSGIFICRCTNISITGTTSTRGITGTTSAGGQAIIEVDALTVSTSSGGVNVAVGISLGAMLMYANIRTINVASQGTLSQTLAIRCTSTGTLYLINDIFVATIDASTSGYGVFLQGSSATVHMLTRRMTVTGGATSSAVGVYADSTATIDFTLLEKLTVTGTTFTHGVEIGGSAVAALRGGGIISGTTFDLKRSGGTLNLYGVSYDPTKTSGTLTMLLGDRIARDELYKISRVTTAGAFTGYADIQAAITAATSGDTVYIPPGTYTLTSTLTMKAGVAVVEMLPGSVTLTYTGNTLDMVTIPATGGDYFLQVHKIFYTMSASAGADHSAITSTHASGTVTIVADEIALDNNDATAKNLNGIYLNGAGTLDVWVRRIYNGTVGGVTRGVSVNAGLMNVRYSTFSTTLDLVQSAGSLYVYAAQYGLIKTSGTISFHNGDRLRVAQTALFARSYS